MTDLVQWLGEQLDTDTARATAARGQGEGRWHREGGYHTGRVENERRETVVYDEGAPLPEEAEHIAEWDPARVLREIESKRRQVEWCVEVIGGRDLSRYDEVGSLKDDKDALAVTLAVETLRLLALPYDARPGYLAEWAPSE